MQGKMKYTSCPFCGSNQIEYKNTGDNDEYSKEELKTLFKEERKYGRVGICLDCGMEFREFIDPKADKKIQSMTKIPIEEYIEVMTKELASIPDINGISIAKLLLENKINSAKIKSFILKK